MSWLVKNSEQGELYSVRIWCLRRSVGRSFGGLVLSERVVAVIPARGGSKGVPRKNVTRVGGVPLVHRSIDAALKSDIVDAVYVTTDDAEIAATARRAGGKIIDRPADIAGDTSSSEAALLHALKVLEVAGNLPEVMVFMQATSPFIDPEDIHAAVTRVLTGQEDVVFSAVETHAFLWEDTEDGAVGVNHDHNWRPRRQERTPHFQETGAFYVLRVDGFLERKFRFFGRLGMQIAKHEAAALEIDNPDQLRIAQACAGLLDVSHEAIDVDALVMDFDGVHTDDSVSVNETGSESVRVSRSDGMGIEMLRKAGLPMLILSKEKNRVVEARAKKLQIEVRQGIENKIDTLMLWCEEKGIDIRRVAYVGNDINDASCLERVGWPITVANSHPDVEKLARFRLRAQGGRGAIREICELILASRRELK
ncbi:3-deoxy-D-manno-octulosonate 8-phosphate phosphatase, YrbI family [Pseudarthrobacter phenanthrenivorans Sphe3]|uniref:N-acylneuraminate cytidylyltransferase n=1 Tax=Pseudarthrobacter phenanthrenivorans (strain DSM 18606 / JCM 16027 / LMG 23796 / Sphe3) TaxID=930171 RepID=F0M1I0_PSEPM|nr:acylneuraminate cytidylyltransferase [Pseudarthrobacter phenanthrenivorans]ADX74176.1 3-deoxy-D-manno-octulosonate 8-phosphate phosphatase, YrbI family [Pseudarthrobacter phenanthrenivorans Sphe3]